jgi:hypothetical protein
MPVANAMCRVGGQGRAEVPRDGGRHLLPLRVSADCPEVQWMTTLPTMRAKTAPRSLTTVLVSVWAMAQHSPGGPPRERASRPPGDRRPRDETRPASPRRSGGIQHRLPDAVRSRPASCGPGDRRVVVRLGRGGLSRLRRARGAGGAARRVFMRRRWCEIGRARRWIASLGFGTGRGRCRRRAEGVAVDRSGAGRRGSRLEPGLRREAHVALPVLPAPRYAPRSWPCPAPPGPLVFGCAAREGRGASSRSSSRRRARS